MITVIDTMGDDLSVVNAARVSFDKCKEVLDESDVKLLSYLANNHHMTPFRHPQISIRCTEPIFLARQLGKHQVGLSWNEVSRRYVHDAPEFFIPSTWRSKPEGNIKQGSGDDVDNQDDWFMRYEKLIVGVKWLYNYMLKHNIAPEQARMVLPQSMLTTWIWTGSLLAFYHVWELRSDDHAQLEARMFAEELNEVMNNAFPYSWAALKGA